MLELVPLASRPDLIPTLADWHFRQWGWMNPENDVAARTDFFREQITSPGIPLTLVALVDGEAAGSASLVRHDLPLRPQLSPWLASVYVSPHHRRRGIGGRLVNRIVEEAGALGHEAVYLFTPDQMALYASLGWEEVETIEFCGEMETVMQIAPAVRAERPKLNEALWDAWARAHHDSATFYDVEAFVQGQCQLREVELAEMGDVDGLDLLHLQCHFGMDTLSWARRGARVTGLDFSAEAIGIARELAQRTGLEATFVHANVLDLPRALHGRFDRVFTSYGALCWLPDLSKWAETVSAALRPGGVFTMVEFHPMLQMLGDDGSLTYGYFRRDAPIELETDQSYGAPSSERNRSYEWTFSLADVVTALLDVGLRLDFLHEHPFSAYAYAPFFEPTSDGKPNRFVAASLGPAAPHMFSIRARKR